jgi:flagellar M-ring protein FliF
MRFLQMVAFSVVGIGVILLTARSVFTGLTRSAVPVALTGPAAQPVGVVSGLSLEQGATGVAAVTARAAPDPAEAAAEEETMVTMNRIQGQMRSSSIRKVSQLVERYPDATLGIIRGWIASDQR